MRKLPEAGPGAQAAADGLENVWRLSSLLSSQLAWGGSRGKAEVGGGEGTRGLLLWPALVWACVGQPGSRVAFLCEAGGCWA